MSSSLHNFYQTYEHTIEVPKLQSDLFDVHAFREREASIKRLACDMAIRYDDHIMTILFGPEWRRIAAATMRMQYLYPNLYPAPKNAFFNKHYRRLRAWFKHFKGYRIVHEDDLDHYY